MKDLGLVTAYGAAKEGGYTGTYEEYKEKMLDLLNADLSNVGGDYTKLENLPKINGVTLTGDKTRESIGIPEFKSIKKRSRVRLANSSDISKIIKLDDGYYNAIGVVVPNGQISAGNYNGEYVSYNREPATNWFKIKTNYSSVNLYDGILFLTVTVIVLNDFKFYPAGGINSGFYQDLKMVGMYLFEGVKNLDSISFKPNYSGPGLCRVYRNRHGMERTVGTTFSIVNKEYIPLYTLDQEMVLRGCFVPLTDWEFKKGETLTFEGVFLTNALYKEDPTD